MDDMKSQGDSTSSSASANSQETPSSGGSSGPGKGMAVGIVVIVLVILGVVFFMNKDKTDEAGNVNTEATEEETVMDQVTQDASGDTKDMEVMDSNEANTDEPSGETVKTGQSAGSIKSIKEAYESGRTLECDLQDGLGTYSFKNGKVRQDGSGIVFIIDGNDIHQYSASTGWVTTTGHADASLKALLSIDLSRYDFQFDFSCVEKNLSDSLFQPK